VSIETVSWLGIVCPQGLLGRAPGNIRDVLLIAPWSPFERTTAPDEPLVARFFLRADSLTESKVQRSTRVGQQRIAREGDAEPIRTRIGSVRELV
jgi:hypothetical protein